MSHPRWTSLLEHPDLVASGGTAMAILADGGDPAHRAALARWIELREGDDRDAHAGIALILAEAFDDRRALDRLAEASDDPYPDEFAWRSLSAPAGPAVRSAFGPKVLRALRAWMSSESTDFPERLILAARTLHPNDEGAVYLPMRRALIERADADHLAIAEQFADELLLAGAVGSADNAEIAQCVLSFWGEAEPVDAVPVAEPGPNAPLASWTATCELLAHTSDAGLATRLIELALTHEEGWRTDNAGAEAFVRALERTASPRGDEVLLQLAKDDLEVSGAAVRALAERRTRLADAPPRFAARVDALLVGLQDAGLVTFEAGPRTRQVLAEQLPDTDSAAELGRAIADRLTVGFATDDAPNWAAFDEWAATAELPPPAPVPAARPPEPPRRRGFGRLFGR